MASRDLREDEHYFPPVSEEVVVDNGVRDMFPLAPFVVSGGKNTERYYFIHVNDLSDKYKFNIRPKYFGDESDYAEVFPKRIKEILSKNIDAKIFCVFDMDAIVKDNSYGKHKAFLNSLQSEIKTGQVVLCESMPSFEFWLLLHFTDYDGLLKNYPEVSRVLAPYIKPYFAESTKNLKKLLKSEKYLKSPGWVKSMLDEGRLELAVKRARACSDRAMTKKGKCSYSNVFKVFEQ